MPSIRVSSLSLVPAMGRPGVDDVEHLQAALGQGHEVLVIAPERGGARRVAADVEDDGVPVQGEGARHLGGQ